MKRKKIFKKVQLIVYDFDGVMTDNQVFVFEDGKEALICNRSDGMAVSKIKNMGIKQIILSTEKNPIVRKRANKLGIPCFVGKDNKKGFLNKYLLKNRISSHRVIFVGNDINDLEVMSWVGYPVATKDAAKEIKKIARITTKSAGGKGVVRELYYYLCNAC